MRRTGTLDAIYSNLDFTVHGFNEFTKRSERPIPRTAQIAIDPRWMMTKRLCYIGLLHSLRFALTPQRLNSIKCDIARPRKSIVGVARMVAHARRTQAGAKPPHQPHARPAVALLSADAFSEDFASEWFLDLWHAVPTPDAAARATNKAIGRILKSHRIRRFDAAAVLGILRQPPLAVAPGTIAAATAHIRTVAARLRLVNTQIKETERRLDELCAAIESAAATAPGQSCEQRDAAILRSCPGLGRINVATLLAEATEPLRRRDYHALRTRSGVAPVTKRSGKSCV
jgi:hypothetical protein